MYYNFNEIRICILFWDKNKGEIYTRQIYNFNTKWGFSKEAVEAPTTMPGRWNWVNLPHTWNNIDGQDGGNDLYRGTAFYAKELEKMDLPKADRYFLEIQGANSSAIV